MRQKGTQMPHGKVVWMMIFQWMMVFQLFRSGCSGKAVALKARVGNELLV